MKKGKREHPLNRVNEKFVLSQVQTFPLFSKITKDSSGAILSRKKRLPTSSQELITVK